MELHDRLARDQWWVGYCRAGAQQGAYVLLWPLRDHKRRIPWDGQWEATFSPNRSFEGVDGEDSFIFRREEAGAVAELERADIEWASDSDVAREIVGREFPDSRAAHEAAGGSRS